MKFKETPILLKTYLAVCLFWIVENGTSGADPQKLELEERLSAKIEDGETHVYIVNGLLKDTKYEVRISYPAVIPTDFLIEVNPVETSTFHNRKLLNVEQLQWKAEHQDYLIKVRSRRIGVPIDLTSLEDPTPFHIIVNRLYFGCSIATWKLLITCLFTCVIVLSLFYRRIIRYIEDIQEPMKTE